MHTPKHRASTIRYNGTKQDKGYIVAEDLHVAYQLKLKEIHLTSNRMPPTREKASACLPASAGHVMIMMAE